MALEREVATASMATATMAMAMIGATRIIVEVRTLNLQMVGATAAMVEMAATATGTASTREATVARTSLHLLMEQVVSECN